METTETCLPKVATELYSKNLINKEVRHSPTFDKIEIDFSAMVSLYKGDAKKMMEVCSLFIECLSTAGGPAQEEAIALARDWENEVFKDHQVLFSTFTKTATAYTPQLEVQLGFTDRVAVELRNLHKKYAKLMTDITTYYASSGKHDAIVIARWVENYYDDETDLDLAHDGVTVDEIFKQIRPHHSFIDIEKITELVNVFPIDDSALQARFDEYADGIDNFINSAELNNIIKTIEAGIIGESTKVDPKIILKLSGRWNEQTIGHVRKLVDYLFNEEAKYVTVKKISRGSISIQFLVFSNRSVQPLIMKSQAKIHFVHLLGIFQLIIDNQTIIDREEDISFTFEESLLLSIASIDSNLEYHRISLLLIELKTKLNYKNTKGQTALMLASQGGHIKTIELLLQNGANPFVQLPANKGYIGLNRLACIALSQHIYKSVGGEKIIPRDDTSVEEMLEMAVKERGVSSHFYEPFMHVIKNKIKEKFQRLQGCFHALDSSFLDVATNILTSKALVTEAKQKFQSYIKEDATCENAHQLVQLLQPHYSCLNINLLTIPCTITEPIKEQVEEYNTNLKMFKDTTSLLELAMMTKGMPCPGGVGCSKMILKLNKPWCSRTIAELNKMENFYLLPISSFLTLQEVHNNPSDLTCVYLIPQLNSQTSIEVVFEQSAPLYVIGVFEVMIDDIPIMMEDENKSFTFEAALKEAHQSNNESLVFFLLELDIILPMENGNNDLMIASRRGDILTVQFLLSKDPDINIQNNKGSNALMAASFNGHHQVVELLLCKDPDINIRNSDGMT
uniref:Death domain-containing protein n=1 Tax=Amphimedon queenslandica TaxID=400682 RepID=A0A1X7T3S2_AMPQE